MSNRPLTVKRQLPTKPRTLRAAQGTGPPGDPPGYGQKSGAKKPPEIVRSHGLQRSMSWRDVANALGCSRTALARMRRDPEFPQGSRDARHIEQIRVWRQMNVRPNDAGTTDGSSAALRAEQMLYTRVRRELLEGKYIEVEVHERAMFGLAETFCHSLDALALSLPLAMQSLGPGEMEKTLVERFADARRQIADRGRIELARAKAAAAGRVPKRGKGRPIAGSGKVVGHRRRGKS